MLIPGSWVVLFYGLYGVTERGSVDQPHPIPCTFAYFTSSFLFQWKATQLLSNGDNLPSYANEKLIWEKPPFGWIKCKSTVPFSLNRENWDMDGLFATLRAK